MDKIYVIQEACNLDRDEVETSMTWLYKGTSQGLVKECSTFSVGPGLRIFLHARLASAKSRYCQANWVVTLTGGALAEQCCPNVHMCVHVHPRISQPPLQVMKDTAIHRNREARTRSKGRREKNRGDWGKNRRA